MKGLAMTKDKSFSDIMKKPDEDQITHAWSELMRLAKKLEDEYGYARDTVLDGFLAGTLDLARKRADERYFRSMNDVRRFYLYASEETKRKFDRLPNYREQREIEDLHGKDMLYYRDAKNFGWEPMDDES